MLAKPLSHELTRNRKGKGKGTGWLTLCYPTSREAFSLVCYAIATLTYSIAHDK